MIFIDKMKNFKLYRCQSFLPTVKANKKKSSAILLMSPNYEASVRLMNNKMFVNSNRFSSYYLEKDVSYYIGSKVLEEVDESAIINEQLEIDEILEETKRSELPDSAFGVPSKRKFPLDTEAHVRSAIKFFNYVDPEDEEELAKNILKAMKKFGIDDVHVSEKNRFSKYYKNPVNEATFDCLPKYHRILTELDLYYYAWKNGTMAESIAKNRILEMMKLNLCLPGDATINDVPSVKEYFTGRGLVKEANEEIIPHEDFLTETLVNHLPEGALNLGDKVMFFNEADANNAQLKRLLYKDRLKKRREVLDIYEKVKHDNPWIKFTYPELSKYVKKNVFVDLYFYNALFFENNKWIQKRGFNLYLDFLTRSINHPNLKAAGYTMQTIFIPVKEWDKTHDGMIWNYRKSINPISCIYQLLFDGRINDLKKIFGSTNVIFLADDKYFKINFAELDTKEIKRLAIKFKLFVIKICKGEEFDYDDIDTTADHKDDSEVIAAKIVDKIELAKGVDLTKHVAKAVDVRAAKKKEIAQLIKAGKAEPPTKKLTANPGTSQAKATIKKVKDEIIDNYMDVDDEADYDNGEIEDIEKAQDAQKLADAIANASDSDSEEDALDTLDNEEIKDILINLGSDDEVNISASRSTRMTKLDQELLNKEINGRTINDILTPKVKKEEELLTVDVASPNIDEWKDLSFVNLDKDYDIDRDIVSIFRKFSTCTRPMVVRDIKVTDNSTSEDRLALYDVQMEDYKGRRFRVKLDIPIMEDNRFLLRGETFQLSQHIW